MLSCGLFAQQAAFEGTATNAVTHEPLSGVHIRLIGLHNMPVGPFDTYGAASDKAGHFSIAPLPPGSYIFMPQYRGFVYAARKEGALPFPSVTLKSGERVADFKLEMTPEAVILGRVVDEYGDPLERAQVAAEALSSDFVTANATFMEGGPDAQTDDRGMFRLTLVPGKYYIKATASNFSNGPPEIRTDGTVTADYAPTWFPGAPGKDSAVVVETRAGAETTGIEVHMGHATRQRTLSISGTVSGIVPGETQGYVAMQFGESLHRITRSSSTQITREGRFTFSKLEPGFYQFFAMQPSPGGGTVRRGPTVEIKLENADVANVELQLSGSGDVTGTFEIEGDPPNAPQEKRSIRLRSTTMFDAASSGDVDRDGSFHIAAVPQGKFDVHIDPLPEDAYVKTVVLDGTVAANGILDLHGVPGARVKIMVSRKGAHLSGRVRDAAGEPVLNSVTVVVLADDLDNVDLDTRDDSHTAFVKADGQYSFQGIRPGKYHLLAIDAFHTADADKPGVMKKLAAAAEEIEIKEGDRISKDVKIAIKEDASAKAKN